MTGPTDQAGPDPTPEPGSTLVDWGAARSTADWVINRRRLPRGYDPEHMTADFAEIAPEAEGLVAAATGLVASHPARICVTDRSGWATANVASLQRLLAPTLHTLEHRGRALTGGEGESKAATWPVPAALAEVGRRANGVQVGLLLSWMSRRVLGQYDPLVSGPRETKEGDGEGDTIFFVGPNIAAIEARYGFSPRPFRLWLAIHEVTHRCQFTAVPWLRDHFVSLVEKAVEPLAADPKRLAEALARVISELRAGRNPLEGSGLMGLIATPEQREALGRIQALMSLLEGHGDVIMDRAGGDAVPGAARFSKVLHDRRTQVGGAAKLMRQALGIEAKMRQYAEGERFVRAAEAAGGSALFDSVWRGPEWLPSADEIRSPEVWVDRVRVGAAIA